MGFINWALMSDYYAHESHELCVVVLWNYMELYQFAVDLGSDE